jgi:hypothetical protein
MGLGKGLGEGEDVTVEQARSGSPSTEIRATAMRIRVMVIPSGSVSPEGPGAAVADEVRALTASPFWYVFLLEQAVTHSTARPAAKIDEVIFIAPPPSRPGPCDSQGDER